LLFITSAAPSVPRDLNGGSSDEQQSDEDLLPVPTSPTVVPRPSVTPRIVNAIVGSRYESKCGLNDYQMSWIRVDGQRSSIVSNNGMLVINSVRVEHAGLYVCYATDDYGSTSPVQSIKIEIVGSYDSPSPQRSYTPNYGGTGAPTISFQPNNFNGLVNVGDQLWVRCVVSGAQPMTVKWTAVGRPSTSS
jgi:hypothetical protein